MSNFTMTSVTIQFHAFIGLGILAERVGFPLALAVFLIFFDNFFTLTSKAKK